MTASLDLEAVKREWQTSLFEREFDGDDLLDVVQRAEKTVPALIAEVERLTAKLKDQTERIAQLHRERGEAVAEFGRLRAEIERAWQPVKEVASAAPGFNPPCDFCGRPRLQVPKLIRARAGGPYICSHCVELCADILREEAGR